jgi:hypothetical protein
VQEPVPELALAVQGQQAPVVRVLAAVRANT